MAKPGVPTDASVQAAQPAGVHPNGSDSIRRDPALDTAIARLDMAYKIRHSNYNSIWEQQKHFTWLISIMLSGQAIVVGAVQLRSPEKSAVLFAASIAGIIISIIGFRVQRIEGIYFCDANKVFAEEYRAVYPDAKAPYRSEKPNKSVSGLIAAVCLGRAGVRDHFQILFLAFIAIFVAIAIYACVSF
jgi:hypothetical protein